MMLEGAQYYPASVVYLVQRLAVIEKAKSPATKVAAQQIL